MLVGEIIKFYREKKGISQSVLAEGICGKSYISRFESGKVILSPVIISRLSDRLGIDIHKEVESYNLIGERLKDWNQSIIMQKANQMEELRLEIEQNPFIMYSKHAAYYLLTKARYYLFKNMFKDAQYTIEYIEREFQTLSKYEKNCLLHSKGMYSLSTYKTIDSQGFATALNYLKQIDLHEYKNEEYYFHLALAYHHAKAKVLAYSYAEKALQFFNNTYNYVQAINAQIIMLMQFESGKEIDFFALVKNYKNLIHNCEGLGAYESKMMLLNNLGKEFFKREEYDQAARYFEYSLLMTDQSSIHYLRRFFHYVEACLEGKLLDDGILIEKIERGIKLAKKQCPISHILFKLLLLKKRNNIGQYYNFLEEVAIPLFILTNNDYFFEKYGKILYLHYINLEQYKKATELDENFRFINASII